MGRLELAPIVSDPLVSPLVCPIVVPLIGPPVVPLVGPLVVPLIGPTVSPLVGPPVVPFIGPQVSPFVRPLVSPLAGFHAGLPARLLLRQLAGADDDIANPFPEPPVRKKYYKKSLLPVLASTMTLRNMVIWGAKFYTYHVN